MSKLCLNPQLIWLSKEKTNDGKYFTSINFTADTPVPQEHRCGKCLNCLAVQKRDWAIRISKELAFPSTGAGNMVRRKGHSGPRRTQQFACFLTLTYDNDHLPEFESVNKKDVQKFLKRLRKRLAPIPLRYFCAAEYAKNTDALTTT